METLQRNLIDKSLLTSRKNIWDNRSHRGSKEYLENCTTFTIRHALVNKFSNGEKLIALVTKI